MPKNVLLYIADSMRADALGCYGQALNVTPNIDRIAERGSLFDAAYTTVAQCAPARASLLSGLYPSRHHVPANGIHLAPHLSAGHWFSGSHAAAWHGHWHLGPERDRYGFTENVYVRGGTDCPVADDEYRRFLTDRGRKIDRFPYCPDETFANGAGRSRLPADEYFGSFLADRAEEALERYAADGRRFFLSVSDFLPHFAFVAPAPYDTMFDPADIELPVACGTEYEGGPASYRTWREQKNKRFDLSERELRRMWAHYLGMCRLVDHNFGRLVAALGRLGLADSTTVVFLADHGEMLGAHGLLHKGPGFYREQMRIPFVIAGPDVAPARRVARPVSIVDVSPTLAELSGVTVPDGLDGRSLVPLLDTPARGLDRDAVIAEYHTQSGDPYPLRAIFTDRYKYHWAQWDREELFDLHNDPDELHNVAEHREYASVKRDLRSRLAVELQDRLDPVASLIARA